MEWARILAYITGTVDQELLLRNEYLAAENRILKALHRWPLISAEGAMPSRSPDSICTRADFREISQRHPSVKIDFGNRGEFPGGGSQGRESMIQARDGSAHP